MNAPSMLILSLAVAVLSQSCTKYFTKTFAVSPAGRFVYNGGANLISALVLLCWGGFGAPSTFTVLLGVAFGVVTALQGISVLAALQCGPMSYTMVITSFSLLVAALSGVAFFDERLSWAQIIGIVFMLGSFVLAVGVDKQGKKANFKWLVLCMAAFALTGGIGVMQKVHQSSPHRDELNAFLVVAFFAGTLLCALFVALLKARETKTSSQLRAAPGRLWVVPGLMLISGGCVAINNKFNLYLSGVMDSAVFFPVFNGGLLVATTLAALVIFKERLTKRQWLGVVLGITSVVFLCNPFG